MPAGATSKRTKRPGTPHPVICCALDLAAKRGWDRVTLGEIAEASDISLAELRSQHASKSSIVKAYVAWVDSQVLTARDPEIASCPATERLFDVLMRRFDILTPQKAGLREILRSYPLDAEAVLCGSLMLHTSAAWMLEAANLSSAGLRGFARTKVLAALYVSMLPIWFGDDSDDMARTMAVLDRRLKRLNSATNVLCHLGSRRKSDDMATEVE